MTTGNTVFAFEAIGVDGVVDRGDIDAESIGAARAIVAARGMFVLSVDARGPRRGRREPLAAADLALGLRMLADLLESGLPVTRALHAFQDLAPRGWRAALPHIRQSVREGKSLAAALASAPIEIPPLVIGIAQAGEAGSGIGAAVRRAAELTEASADMRSSVRSALAYPAIVAFAGAVAVTVLITVVLPRFARILSDLGQQLPASTQFVLHAANAGHSALVPGVAGLVVLAGFWRAWTNSEAGLAQWHKCLLMTPILGAARRGAGTARMANALSALLESGVPVAAAMTFASRAAGDGELEVRLREARKRIVGGEPLALALEATDAATETTIKLVRAGEESGRLPGMLAHAARIEQKRVDQTVKTAVRMLEPALLLAFSSVVALVAAALLQAIYSVRPA